MNLAVKSEVQSEPNSPKPKRLSQRTPARNRAYLKYLRGRQRAALLGFMFVAQTSNRIGTAHNCILQENLVFSTHNGLEVAVYVPAGSSPTKVEAAAKLKGARGGRMPRQFFVARKILSPSFAKDSQGLKRARFTFSPRISPQGILSCQGPSISQTL